MSLESNLSKRIKAMKDIEKITAQLIYYRDNREFMNNKKRIVVWKNKDV